MADSGGGSLYDPGTDTGGGGGGKPTVTDLGNGYSLIEWIDQNGLGQHSIVPNKDAASVAAVEAAKIGAGAAGVSASISANAANQRAAVQAEIDRAKNAADEAHQKAMDALAQGNAAEARRQFDISSAELQRYHTLDVGIRQQEANTSATTAGYNIYKDLTDKASNPRNYMEQFFKNRGQAAPANAGLYSNTATGPLGIMPFEKWLPNFMSQTLGSYGQPSTSSPGAGAANSPAASAPPPSGAFQGQAFGTGQGSAYSGLNHFNAGGPITLAKNDPDAAGLIAKNPGMYQMGPDLGLPTANHPPMPSSQTQQFADGGTLRMTAPHAIINMLSGKVAAIAGEQPGRGPQGFVPETAKFDGQAIVVPGAGDENHGGPVLEPTPPADTTPPPPPADTTPPPTGTSPVAPTPTPAPVAPPPPAPPIPGLGTQPAPPGFHWVGTQLVPDAPAPVVTPPPPPPPVFGPGINPGGGNWWGGPTTTPPNPANPPQVTTPGFDFTQTPSGIGQNPTFLPEDAAAQDPILKAMLDAGSFPPFLQRLYAQAKGLPGLGTNTLQATDLPAGVPLISQLALNQMSPSEFAAFQSFLSAHGIDWNDYVTMVQQASPQGGRSTSSAVPKFLSQGG